MSSQYLSSNISNAKYDIKRGITRLCEKIDRETASNLSFFYRQKGACDFFLTGQTDVFFDCLHRSAGCYLYFLKNATVDQKMTTDNDAFFDAINAGFTDCACLIAENSRKTWNSDAEYEDDFLYNHFLHEFFFSKDPDRVVKCEKIISGFEKALQGGTDIRLDICISFLNSDQNSFLKCFEQYLTERAEYMKKMIAHETIGEDVWSWSRYFFPEGLALLKLAETKSFQSGSDYLQIPEALRKHPVIEFNQDLWKS